MLQRAPSLQSWASFLLEQGNEVHLRDGVHHVVSTPDLDLG